MGCGWLVGFGKGGWGLGRVGGWACGRAGGRRGIFLQASSGRVRGRVRQDRSLTHMSVHPPEPSSSSSAPSEPLKQSRWCVPHGVWDVSMCGAQGRVHAARERALAAVRARARRRGVDAGHDTHCSSSSSSISSSSVPGDEVLPCSSAVLGSVDWLAVAEVGSLPSSLGEDPAPLRQHGTHMWAVMLW
jgi:hypothetical protein